jgi:hypothetical protein
MQLYLIFYPTEVYTYSGNGCFDVLELTVVLVVLELLGLLRTELEICDWELVYSVMEPSCSTPVYTIFVLLTDATTRVPQ